MFPPSVHKSSLFLHILTKTCYFCLLYNSYFNRCKVISQCGFDFHSLMTSDVRHLFIYTCWHSVCFLWENVYPFLNQTFSPGCMISLHILAINPLFIYRICKYFLPILWLPFILWWFPLPYEVFQVFIVPPVYFCFSHPLLLMSDPRKSSPMPMRRNLLTMITSGVFIVSDIASKSLTHFESIFCE